VRAKDAVGRYGEDVAARHLAAAGFVLLDRNWRCAAGEIDIVAVDRETLVFCEVKTRRGLGFGGPLDAVTHDKVRRLRGLALHWLAERRELISAAGRPAGLGTVPPPPIFSSLPPPIRFDVVGVMVPARGPANVTHVRGVM
jgi:putative endonuclease